MIYLFQPLVFSVSCRSLSLYRVTFGNSSMTLQVGEPNDLQNGYFHVQGIIREEPRSQLVTPIIHHIDIGCIRPHDGTTKDVGLRVSSYVPEFYMSAYNYNFIYKKDHKNSGANLYL